MPDITMCNGESCPKKEDCWRFTATPDKYWQSYFSESPMAKYGECDHFWPDRRRVAEPEADKGV